MTVDRERRDRLAELLRHFAAGRITNDQWVDASSELATTEDPAPREVRALMWGVYDDLYEHRLTGKHRPNEEWRGWVARMILFLYSDLPYEWPAQRRYKRWELVLALLTLGLFNANPPVRHPMRDEANRNLWPFFRPADVVTARSARPRLLAGAR